MYTMYTMYVLSFLKERVPSTVEHVHCTLTLVPDYPVQRESQQFVHLAIYKYPDMIPETKPTFSPPSRLKSPIRELLAGID